MKAWDRPIDCGKQVPKEDCASPRSHSWPQLYAGNCTRGAPGAALSMLAIFSAGVRRERRLETRASSGVDGSCQGYSKPYTTVSEGSRRRSIETERQH